MKHNKAYFGNERMNKIIALSGDYKRHRDIIANIKPGIVDFTDAKHMKKIAKLSIQKDKYWNNANNFKLNEMKRQNQNLLKRILLSKSPLKKEFSPKTSRLNQNKTLEHTSSNKSFKSVSSQKSCMSNFRRRTLRQIEIDTENKKIANRIMHPKMAKDMNVKKMVKLYEKEQSFCRIRSRFSDRSQNIMQSLALDTLKLQKKYLQFLPQLSFKKLAINPNKNKTTRQTTKKNQTPLPITIDPQS